MNKLKKLKGILEKMGSVLVAYSAGADSTLLLKIASDVLGDRVMAVTATSPTYTKEELIVSKRMTKVLGVTHKIINTNEFKDKKFIANPANRCYFCKKELFGRLTQIAKKFKLNFVADGTNLSDVLDFRPGNKAKKEFKVRSPLKEAGINKDDIRKISRKIGLVTWDKPTFACLASRVPYGTAITKKIIQRIEKAESFLRKIGFKQARVRHYNGLCRIEVPQSSISKLISKRSELVLKFKKIGYNYITLDLQGYRSGSMNEILTVRKGK
jgi:uncharacterized protein